MPDLPALAKAVRKAGACSINGAHICSGVGVRSISFGNFSIFAKTSFSEAGINPEMSWPQFKNDFT
jgi:hypothetical protein